ncbi:AIPR family protein [Planctomyces sp. SH-PL62]|uniref:AIPR family protein n=1 Tax=Planctomyces sp. SH-PL62 TaxID=1636152 RepID=UPI00078EB131|nr:AIPR family protein [Planctomyces sp. SH-PL62]AMV40488.1 AIPR protein [Planctomyces sp. SH-PL62]
MKVDVSLQEYADELRLQVDDQSTSAEGSGYWINTFTRVMIERLEGLGVLDGGEDCYHKARGIEVNGYHLSEDDGRLDLFTCIHAKGSPPPTVGKDLVDAQFRRLAAFLGKCFDGLHRTLEQSSELHAVAHRIYQHRKSLEKVRLFLFTDGQVKLTKYGMSAKSDDDRLAGIKLSCEIWDITRLHRFETSGSQAEPIEIDLKKQFGQNLPCLVTPGAAGDCAVYLTYLPGEILSELYETHGLRMLERNVRAFLQIRGKVNQGIRRTLINEPQRFLAFNNGISAVADAVTLVEVPGGGRAITHIRNLQIVNGGQTTATIHHARFKDGAKLDGVMVQTKLTVVPEEAVEGVVPLISQYANSQNKVSEADFAANEAFHVRIEKLSRTTLAPAPAGGQESYWFYERVRGQYLYEQGRLGTLARKKRFRELYPPTQRFSKTDIGKLLNSWHQLPHVVSLGAQKNFLQFMSAARGVAAWDKVETRDFNRIVALAILFKRTDQIIQGLDLGGYKANIVTYSIAYLAHSTGGRLDLDRIWKEQELSEPVEQAIARIGLAAQQCITSPPGGQNIGEWCKAKRCWEALRGQTVNLGAAFRKSLACEPVIIPKGHADDSEVTANGGKSKSSGQVAVG